MQISRTSAPARAAQAPPAPSPAPADVAVSSNAQDTTVLSNGAASVKSQTAAPLRTAKVAFKKNPPQPVSGAYVYADSDSRVHGALPFAAAASTVAVFESALGKPITWSFHRDRLDVVPDRGQNLNAFYDAFDGTLNFFHAVDPRRGHTIYTGDSGEVASHETGHAILDALRPGYLQSFGYDTRAFHEAFGDVTAMIMSLRDERTLDLVMAQTNGDLSKPNAVAAMGEQLGMAINHNAGQNVTGGPWLRNAINTFTWARPSSLPTIGGPDQLGNEEHSFSRLWTGATYDVLRGIVNRSTAAGIPARDALRAAGDELLTIYVNLFKTAPQGEFTYKDMALAMIKADRSYNSGRNADLMTQVFTRRKIIPRDAVESLVTEARPREDHAPPSADPGTFDLQVTLRGDGFGMFDGAVVEVPIDADGALTQSTEVGDRLRESMRALIAAGRIKYTEPNQKLEKRDLFDSEGRPYVGVVRWLDGRMRIERTAIAS